MLPLLMDVTATPAMAEKHIKPNSIGLQSQAEHWYEQEEVPQARSSPPFPLTIRAQPRRVTFLTTTTAFRENRENDRVGAGGDEDGDACAHMLRWQGTIVPKAPSPANPPPPHHLYPPPMVVALRIG